MNIKKTALLISFFAFFSISQLYAETIVTVKAQDVMQNSEAGKKAQRKLQAEGEKLSKPLQEKERQLKQKEDALLKKKEQFDKDVTTFEKESSLLSPEARQEKVEKLQERAQALEEERVQLDTMIKSFQTEAKRVEGKMQQLHQAEMMKLNEKVTETIKDLAKMHNWDIVLMEEQVVFASPKVSKTNTVIAELDKREKSASAKGLHSELSRTESALEDTKKEIKKLESKL